MQFDIKKSIEILNATPWVIMQMVLTTSKEWVMQNEGPDTWSVYDIVGHLIHGEKTDWIPRMNIILSDAAVKKFPVFDRFAQFKESKRKSLKQLTNEFKALRKENIATLRRRKLRERDLDQTGIHPEFGIVTLRQHLATWVVHDLNHIAQIARVMAKQYKTEVGPWVEYLPVLKK